MANILLKNHNGDEEIFEGVDRVKLNTTDGGTQIFSEGEVIDEVAVELNLAEGDQTVTAPPGMLVKSATIIKPETLKPENIVKDVEIAGVVGTHSGGVVELDKRLGFFKLTIDMTAKVITLYGVMYDLIYAETGSYDVTIPDHFIGFENYSVEISAI